MSWFHLLCCIAKIKVLVLYFSLVFLVFIVFLGYLYTLCPFYLDVCAENWWKKCCFACIMIFYLSVYEYDNINIMMNE